MVLNRKSIFTLFGSIVATAAAELDASAVLVLLRTAVRSLAG